MNSRPRRLIIIDQNATDGAGHCQAYCRMLSSEARARGLDFRLLLPTRAAGLAERLGGEPVLTTINWGDPELRRFTFAAEWVRNVRTTEQSLAKALVEVNSQDIVLVHTAVSPTLFALTQWLLSLPEERRPQVAAVLHNREKTKNRDDRWIAEALFRRTLREAAPLVGASRLRLFATNQRLVDYLAAGFGIGIVPILCDVELAADRPRPANSPVTLVHSGGYLLEQGLQFLVDAATGAGMSAFHGIRLLLHTRNNVLSGSVRAQLRSCVDAEFIDGELSDDAYRELLGRSDAVLVPYHPRFYGFRHSNKVMEALAMGLPSVVTRDTPAGDALIEAGLPGVLMDPSAESLAAAVVQLRDQYDQLRAIAKAAAPRYRRETSPAFYLQVIEESFLKP